MLEARQLAASRGDANLFSGLDFELKSGMLLRVSGPNGSGKTSLLRALCGLLMPSAGEVRWDGENIRSQREEYSRRLLYVGHANALKDDLTAAENLAFGCALSGLTVPAPRIQAALETMGLAGREKLPAKALSQGQRRRATLARLAVAELQPLWVLDEPLAALDAAAVDQVLSLANGHLARGGMLVLTTHQDARIDASSSIDIRLERR